MGWRREPSRPGRTDGIWCGHLALTGHGHCSSGSMAIAKTPRSTWRSGRIQSNRRLANRGGAGTAPLLRERRRRRRQLDDREDRELAIADNVAYVGQVIDAVRAEFPTRDVLVFAGFSQGTAMAFRGAAHVRANAVIALGADVPPDVAAGTSIPRPIGAHGRGAS